MPQARDLSGSATRAENMDTSHMSAQKEKAKEKERCLSAGVVETRVTRTGCARTKEEKAKVINGARGTPRERTQLSRNGSRGMMMTAETKSRSRDPGDQVKDLEEEKSMKYTPGR